MGIASRRIAGIAVAAALTLPGIALASRPSMNECFEGSDFIANAARSRDAGLSGSAFLGRMKEDFAAIRAFPSELRWFIHDSNDEAFLLDSARQVFDHPALPEQHRNAFLRACIERMPEPLRTGVAPLGDAPGTRSESAVPAVD